MLLCADSSGSWPSAERVLELFFTVRAFRVMLSVAEKLRDQAIGDGDEDDDGNTETLEMAEHVLRSWTVSSQYRDAVWTLIQNLVDLLEKQSSGASL